MATTVADAPLRTPAKVSRAGWYALFLVSAAQGLSLLDRQILSILAPSIREDLQIGDAELGLLYGTLFSLFYALFSLPLGRLVDGWIRTKLLAICIFAWSIFAGLSAFAGGFGLLAVSRLGVGVGEAAAQPAANSIIFDTFPREKRGTAMAAMGIATALGLGLSMTLGGVVAGWWDAKYPDGAYGFSGWQGASFGAIVGVGLMLLAALLALPAYLRWSTEVYLVTDRRVIRVEGVLRKQALDSGLAKVNDVRLTQTVAGRLLGYGTLEIITASESGINRLDYLPRPMEFKKAMMMAGEARGGADISPAAASRPAAPPTSAAPTRSLTDRLADLEEMRRRELLSDDEYQAKRSAILDEL